MADDQSGTDRGAAFALFVVLHLLCCGIPLLLLSGVSLAFLAPAWPLLGGVLAVLGIVGFVWHLKRGCPTCPRNEACRLRPASKSIGDGRRG